MADVFISYTKSDRLKAQILADALQGEGWSVWWDPKIPPGRTYDEVIDQALRQAKCVIVLWSTTSAGSRWVKAEASEGNLRGVLVPALIEDGVTIPLEFRYQHASRLTDWRGQPDHIEYSAVKAEVARLLGTRATTHGYQDPPIEPAITGSPGDIIIGVWEHYCRVPDAADFVYTSRVVCNRLGQEYSLAIVHQNWNPLETSPSRGIFDVESDGAVLRFKSDWGDGEVAQVELYRKSDSVFEGTSKTGGVVWQFDRFVRIDPATPPRPLKPRS